MPKVFLSAIQFESSALEAEILCQGVWGEKMAFKYQSQPMGFEMPGNDDSWYACLGGQGHLWVYWLHPLDLCNIHYESTIFPALFQGFSVKLF